MAVGIDLLLIWQYYGKDFMSLGFHLLLTSQSNGTLSRREQSHQIFNKN